MILIDFEKVMRSTLTEEVASSIIYSFMGTSLSLEGVYNNFNPYIKNKLNINALNLKRAVVRKSAEYLIHRKINCFLGNSKECEVAKAEGFFSEAIKLLDTPKGKG